MSCWVVPGASRSQISGWHGSSLKVRVSAPAEAGRANAELIRLLEACFGCRCSLVAGGHGRRKQVLLEGLDSARAGELIVREIGG